LKLSRIGISLIDCPFLKLPESAVTAQRLHPKEHREILVQSAFHSAMLLLKKRLVGTKPFWSALSQTITPVYAWDYAPPRSIDFWEYGAEVMC
jgi:hypothetical protein